MKNKNSSRSSASAGKSGSTAGSGDVENNGGDNDSGRQNAPRSKPATIEEKGSSRNVGDGGNREKSGGEFGDPRSRSSDYHQGYYDGFHHGARTYRENEHAGTTRSRDNPDYQGSATHPEGQRDESTRNNRPAGDESGDFGRGPAPERDWESVRSGRGQGQPGSGQESFGAQPRTKRSSGSSYRPSGDRFDRPSHPAESEYGTQRGSSAANRRR